jgi:hypothetical protein
MPTKAEPMAAEAEDQEQGQEQEQEQEQEQPDVEPEAMQEQPPGPPFPEVPRRSRCAHLLRMAGGRGSTGR